MAEKLVCWMECWRRDLEDSKLCVQALSGLKDWAQAWGTSCNESLLKSYRRNTRENKDQFKKSLANTYLPHKELNCVHHLLGYNKCVSLGFRHIEVQIWDLPFVS